MQAFTNSSIISGFLNSKCLPHTDPSFHLLYTCGQWYPNSWINKTNLPKPPAWHHKHLFIPYHSEFLVPSLFLHQGFVCLFFSFLTYFKDWMLYFYSLLLDVCSRKTLGCLSHHIAIFPHTYTFLVPTISKNNIMGKLRLTQRKRYVNKLFHSVPYQSLLALVLDIC